MIRETIDGDGSSVFLTFDVTKPFDVVDQSHLIGNCDCSSCKFIASYLSGRSQYVSYNGNVFYLRLFSNIYFLMDNRVLGEQHKYTIMLDFTLVE